MSLGLLRRDLPGGDHLRHETLVFGQLRDYAIAEEIRTAVAELRDSKRAACYNGGGQRRTHAAEIPIALTLLEHGLVRFFNRISEGFGEIILVKDSSIAQRLCDIFSHKFDGH